jgi:hypothetical protein
VLPQVIECRIGIGLPVNVEELFSDVFGLRLGKRSDTKEEKEQGKNGSHGCGIYGSC